MSDDKKVFTAEATKSHRREFLDKVKKYLPLVLTEEQLILRAQLLTEYYLNSLLIVTLPKEEGFYFASDQMRFSEKIKKIRETKTLLPNEIEAVSRLNKLRNKFAHDLDYKVSEADLDFIGFCFGKDYLKDKYVLGNDEKSTPMKERLWTVLLDVVLGPATKVWTILIN